MNTTEAMRLMLKMSKRSAASVSVALGLSRNNIANSMNMDVDFGASKLAAIAQECGWKLMLVRGDESLEIEPRSKNADSDKGAADL